MAFQPLSYPLLESKKLFLLRDGETAPIELTDVKTEKIKAVTYLSDARLFLIQLESPVFEPFSYGR